LGGTSLARAAEEKVELEKVPPFIRHEIEKDTKSAAHPEVVKVTTEGRPDEEWVVKYSEQGKPMTLRLDPTGRVLEQAEAHVSQHKEEQALVAKAKDPQEKMKVEEELASKREKMDREKFAAFKEAEAKEAAIHPENAERSFVGIKEMSEEYNSKDLRRVPAAELPPGVRKTFDMETIGTTDVDYYKYTVDGKLFYSAHYNTDAGRRIICRVDQYGKLLGKSELKAVSAAPAPVAEHAVGGLHLEQMPPNIQATMTTETQGSKDKAYYKITRGDAVFYTVHYTTPENRRYDLWLDPEGHVVSHLLCVLQPGDRDYKKYEWGG
jgi:hypothetical protein